MDSLYKTVCLLLAIGNALHTNTLVVGQYIQMSDRFLTIPFSLKSRPFSFLLAFRFCDMVVQRKFLLSSNVSINNSTSLQCNVDCHDSETVLHLVEKFGEGLKKSFLIR